MMNLNLDKLLFEFELFVYSLEVNGTSSRILRRVLMVNRIIDLDIPKFMELFELCSSRFAVYLTEAEKIDSTLVFNVKHKKQIDYFNEKFGIEITFESLGVNRECHLKLFFRWKKQSKFRNIDADWDKD